MDLQPLFDAPILEQTYLDRDYDGFGNDVWVVQTEAGRVVVRVSTSKAGGGSFWGGVERLFGIDSADAARMRIVNDAVSRAGHFRAPRVLRTGEIDGRSCVVTEFMYGLRVDSFDDLSPAAAEGFGSLLARSHAVTYEYCGAPGGETYAAGDFHERVAKTIQWAARQFRSDAEDHAIADDCAAKLRALPPPASASLILFDIGGSQYLWDDDRPTAVVDTEVFVNAPRELELIVLESDNGATFCEGFRRGYEAFAPLPDLAPVRDAYRCLIALLEVNGRMSLPSALKAPAYF